MLGHQNVKVRECRFNLNFSTFSKTWFSCCDFSCVLLTKLGHTVNILGIDFKASLLKKSYNLSQENNFLVYELDIVFW